MNFGQMLELLKKGSKCRRNGWNGKGIFIKISPAHEYSADNDMTFPFIYIDTTGLQTDNLFAPQHRVPWLPSQTDILCEDWEVVE